MVYYTDTFEEENIRLEDLEAEYAILLHHSQKSTSNGIEEVARNLLQQHTSQMKPFHRPEWTAVRCKRVSRYTLECSILVLLLVVAYFIGCPSMSERNEGALHCVISGMDRMASTIENYERLKTWVAACLAEVLGGGRAVKGVEDVTDDL